MIPIPAHDICHLPTQRLGKRVWSFPSLDSTNNLALALGDDLANDGLALIAQEQSAGRGQYGRAWTAPPHSSVLLSVLLFPAPALRRPALLTALAAVAVCETILEVAGLQATIKWPNDVLIQGKKVCGILIEQRNTGLDDWPLAAALGIGLNVRQSADFFAQANLPLAGSLASLSGKCYAPQHVAERLIGQLDTAYVRLLQGDADTLETLWKQRFGLMGKQVALHTAHERKEGRLLDMAWDGVVLEDAGEIVRVAPELVRHLAELKATP
jgi:BirA family biotin operon repressor/biotin-[acetyl-CoA-carboxylase] ligase